jgi:hypothetical protein
MSSTDQEEKIVKRSVAKHYLLNANGDVVDSEEEATGIRYVQIATSEQFDWQVPNAKPGTAETMVAIFGAKTLATNEASQVRNNPKGGGGDDEQMAAIRDRFELLGNGKWVDRSREGVATVNKDALAEAIVRVLLSESRIQEDEVDESKAKLRQKLDDDPGYVRTVRLHPKVTQEYATLVGRQTKTTEDLLSGLK